MGRRDLIKSGIIGVLALFGIDKLFGQEVNKVVQVHPNFQTIYFDDIDELRETFGFNHEEELIEYLSKEIKRELKIY